MLHHIGAHSLLAQGDLLMLKIVGDFSLEEMRRILAIIDGVVQQYGRWGVVADVYGMRSVSPPARALAGRWPNIIFSYGTAVCGANILIRTITTLIARATELFTGRKGHLAYFKSEAAGLAWLQARRSEAVVVP